MMSQSVLIRRYHCIYFKDGVSFMLDKHEIDYLGKTIENLKRVDRVIRDQYVVENGIVTGLEIDASKTIYKAFNLYLTVSEKPVEAYNDMNMALLWDKPELASRVQDKYYDLILQAPKIHNIPDKEEQFNRIIDLQGKIKSLIKDLYFIVKKAKSNQKPLKDNNSEPQQDLALNDNSQKINKLHNVHKALIKALSSILKKGTTKGEITRDSIVRKTNYSVGSGNVNRAFIDLKDWGIFTEDGQGFMPEFQHYKENPPD